jgi:hypothetical protein
MDLQEWQAWWKHQGSEGVSVILSRDWNPIGVDWPDEYSSYAGRVGRMLREGAGAEAIAAELGAARTDSMGLPAQPEADAAVAAALIAWYATATGTR